MRSVIEEHPNGKGDYLMIEALRIDNFRCFGHVSVEGLKRINVIVGRNASGKTAFLEAVFLAAANHAEIPFRLRNWRLLGDADLSANRSLESLWRDLFHSFDLSKAVSIRLKGTPEYTQGLNIRYNALTEVVIPLSDQSKETDVVLPIEIEKVDGQGNITAIPMRLTEKGLQFQMRPASIKASFYPSSIRANPQEAARRFSALSKLNQESQVIETLQRVYPFIENLSVETSGGEFLIYASVTGLHEKIPVSLISDGVYRLMSILLGIADTDHGVVIVDEIENGLYYETLPEVWRLLLEFSEQYKAQLFVTTHSLEAIKNLLPALETHEGKFSLLRTEKTNGECVIRQFPGMSFKNAIEQRIEVR